ncbi:MAG TPA: 5'/3'-nucleotidase SurE [Acidobacteriota bacterium]|nr:5'/3'-nucleotidase SurE [Acidobacteriota bacterium]
MPLILLTNDDGIEAEGLKCLEESLQDVAEIVIVAPDSERSAVSHGLTIDRPLTLKSVPPNRYVLDGTPADCVIHALKSVVKAPPDLVISGINRGANLADDIMYSGTVAGAREASKHGIPSLAVSQAYDDRPIHYKDGARFVRNFVRTLCQQKLSSPFCLNINFPVRRIKGVKITRQGCLAHFPHFNYLAGQLDDDLGSEAADVRKRSEITLDFQAIQANYISITPLQRDQTDYAAARSLIREAPQLFKGFHIPGFGLIG